MFSPLLTKSTLPGRAWAQSTKHSCPESIKGAPSLASQAPRGCGLRLQSPWRELRPLHPGRQPSERHESSFLRVPQPPPPPVCLLLVLPVKEACPGSPGRQPAPHPRHTWCPPAPQRVYCKGANSCRNAACSSTGHTHLISLDLVLCAVSPP